MGNIGWETLDTQKVIERRNKQLEQTTSGGVGGYEKPLGGPLRRPIPVPPYKEVKQGKTSKK